MDTKGFYKENHDTCVHGGDSSCHECHILSLKKEIDRLNDELDENFVDAERYRYIKNHLAKQRDVTMDGNSSWGLSSWYIGTGRTLDEVIDQHGKTNKDFRQDE